MYFLPRVLVQTSEFQIHTHLIAIHFLKIGNGKTYLHTKTFTLASLCCLLLVIILSCSFSNTNSLDGSRAKTLLAQFQWIAMVFFSQFKLNFCLKVTEFSRSKTDNHKFL